MDARGAPGERLRLAELIATLSLATDLGLGQPLEYLLRTCVLAVRLAQSLRLPEPVQHDVYFVALLRWIGCSGHAHELSQLYPDEIAARARYMELDPGNPMDVLIDAIRHVGEGQPLPERLRTLLAALAQGPRKGPQAQFRASCEVAQLLAERLGMGEGVRAALWHAFERWDGRGFPNGVKGDEIALPMRVVHVAQDAEVAFRNGGVEAAVATVRGRSGKGHDSAIAAAFCEQAAELYAALDGESTWQRAMEVEPLPRNLILAGDVDAALEVVADFVDLKSPYTGGHSRGVAALAAGAAQGCSLPAAEVASLRRAALVHDLGRIGVPNSIWEKAGRLSDGEWERVRLHPYLTGRLLARPAALAALADVAAAHHERSDGSGYHRAATAAQLPPAARILAAADAYQAMTEPRSYRPARPAAVAAAELRTLAKGGRLDGEVVEAVLAAAGHRPRRGRALPADLSTREVEVLRLVARGLPNRETARVLGISERTAAHHIQHVYEKIGVSTRGAAALYAMQNGLLNEG